MDTPDLTFFDIVRIADSEHAREVGLAGAEAVLLGVSDDEITGERWWAVAVQGHDSTMFPLRDLVATGRSTSPEEFYAHGSMRVSQDGELLGFADHDPDPDLDRGDA